MAKATSKQVRQSEAKRIDNGEKRISASGWVLLKHKKAAGKAGKKAFDEAIKQYQKKKTQ